ncbi:MAG: TerB family tellurite resistance protein [Pirellulaceae bacterium]
MILIGTMQWASTRLKGMFACPNCGTTEDFRLRASRPFLTLYFIPILPIGALQEYVQCRKCKNAFEPIILSTHMLPGGSVQTGTGKTTTAVSTESLSPFEDDLLSVLALMMVEDGHVTEEEIRVARRLYENISEQNLSRDDLGAACARVQLQRLNTTSFLATCRTRRSHEEKLLLVQAMFGVSGADGDISPGRLQSLLRSKELLGIDEAEFQRAVDATSQWLT